jgi:Cu(I)/Ag(I) efflux system membrane fusion protein
MTAQFTRRATTVRFLIPLAMLCFAANGALAQPATQSSTPAAAVSTAALNEADGTVKSISGKTITLAHEPVKSLGWPAMTMPFQLARAELAAGLKPGDRVHFSFRENDEGYIIEKIRKTGNPP